MRFEELTPAQARTAELMTTGGDARIVLDSVHRRNRYHSAPYPQNVLAYASSTANDISPDTFAHVSGLGEQGYEEGLEQLRRRIRAAYAVPDDVAIVFAPSGTDLEYVALACVHDWAERLHNVLLGADEVGSGCIHSAHGRYFAKETALGVAVEPGARLPGLGEKVTIEDVPVRDSLGHAFTSAAIRDRIEQDLDAAARAHALVHVVHGSKTGLILPLLDDLDALTARHDVTLVVDACQARITSAAIADYLARDAIVFVTGSKFMGGPPFSGFALVPRAVANRAPALPESFRDVFRRAEWPAGWPGAELLEDSANPGLLLRLEAAVFELERFQQLPLDRVTRVILAFHAAVREAMVDRLGGRRMAPYPLGHRAEGDAHPIEMRTLSTIDLSRRPGHPDFDEAVRVHKALVDQGIRLGQPVKCVKLEDGRWGATLRVGVSMPQVVALDRLPDDDLRVGLAADMHRIATAIEQV